MLPFVFGKIAHLLDVRVAKLASALDKVLPRNRFVLIQQELLLVDEAEQDEPFRADHSELLVLVVLSFEPILHVQEVQVHFEGVLRDTVLCQGCTPV